MKTIPVTSEAEAFFAQYPTFEFEKGKVLLRADKPVTEIFFLRSGSVQMSSYTQDGQLVQLHVFRPGAFFPMMLSLGEVVNRFIFSAVQDGTASRIPVEEMAAFLKEHPEAMLQFTQRLSLAINGLLLRIESLSAEKVPERIGRLFLYLIDRFGKEENGAILIDLPLSHEEISQWIGASRETVSRYLGELQDKKIIARRKKYFIILDRKALEE